MAWRSKEQQVGILYIKVSAQAGLSNFYTNQIIWYEKIMFHRVNGNFLFG